MSDSFKLLDYSRFTTYSIKERISKVDIKDFSTPWKKGSSFSDFLDTLHGILGDKGLLTGADIHSGYHTDPRGVGDVQPDVVLRPASTDEMSQIMAICHAASRPVVV